MVFKVFSTTRPDVNTEVFVPKDSSPFYTSGDLRDSVHNAMEDAMGEFRFPVGSAIAIVRIK